MPIRTLVYTVLYWDRCLRAWVADKDEAKGRFFLPPVVPIVRHAGQRPWGSAKTLAELLGEPAAFHQYAPIWDRYFGNCPITAWKNFSIPTRCCFRR